MKPFVLFAAPLLIMQPASACLLQPSPMSLDLPMKWESKPLVARVEPLELVRPFGAQDDSWSDTGRIRVRVVEALKGLEEGQIFVVQTSWDGQCGWSFPNDKTKFEEFAKRSYYIGGEFQVFGGFVVSDFRVIGGERLFLSFWSWQDFSSAMRNRWPR
ncbi:hypothetical protein IC762_07180 [Bradyrhizobium genosp. L]|uniref:hypothetical protein n=1 Tax=Bradyrhizobium genosp. L TaxID=83637 RepID=UPI0018A283C5|nr:hypothetical protein [Bradyrhizobium genosp. L]QPF86076.1 hypothetical protein IC762_07180 [Bradyrhizobium genosp. L]